MKLKLKTDETLDSSPDSSPAPAQTAPPTTVSVRVIQVAKNPRFVYCDLAGNRIAVAVPQKIAAKLAGKFINVTASATEDETTYTYQP